MQVIGVYSTHNVRTTIVKYLKNGYIYRKQNASEAPGPMFCAGTIYYEQKYTISELCKSIAHTLMFYKGSDNSYDVNGLS